MQRRRKVDRAIGGRAIENVAIGALGVEHQPVHVENDGGDFGR